MVEEVYNAVENYLKADLDPKRIKAKKLIEEEDFESPPKWRLFYRTLPLGQLPSVEDCENLAPLRLKILVIVPYRRVLHTSTPDTSAEPATEPATEQLTPMSKGKAKSKGMAKSKSKDKSNSKKAASDKTRPSAPTGRHFFVIKGRRKVSLSAPSHRQQRADGMRPPSRVDIRKQHPQTTSHLPTSRSSRRHQVLSRPSRK